MAYSANSSFTSYPYLASHDPSTPYYDADPSVWGSDAQVAASTSYSQNCDHAMRHEGPEDAPLTQFQKSVREEDERFYAMFPEARPDVDQWKMVQFKCNDIWDGVGFQFTPPQYPSTSMVTNEPVSSAAVPPCTNELPVAPIAGTSTTLHYNYDFNFSPHGSLPNATQDTEMPLSSHSSPAWSDPVQSPADSKSEAYDQSYCDVNSSYNAFPSSSLEAGIEHHPTPHQDSRSLVSNEPYTTYLPSPASPAEEAGSPSSFHAASPTLDLPFATTSDQQFFEEHSYEDSATSGDWSMPVPATMPRRQLATAANPLREHSIPSSSKSPTQRQVGAHRHERRHSHARLVSPQPHSHGRCTTPKRHRSPSPDTPLSPNSQAKRLQEKKPPLACLFCRGRKIACGPPVAGTKDKTCNQCQRRSLKCEYPSESRRGMRKKKASVNASGPKVTVKASKS